MSAGLASLHHLLGPGDRDAAFGWWPGLALAVGALALAAPDRRLSTAGALIMTVVPVVLILPALTGAAQLTGHWPLVVAGLAAGLALLLHGETSGRSALPWAIFPLGAALVLVIVLAWPGGPPQMLVRSFAHRVLLVLTGAILAALLMGFSRPDGLSGKDTGFVRALMGLLPLLGFTGTILGIMQALSALPAVFEGEGPAGLAPVLAGLATAFETTLIGLVGAISASFGLVVLSMRMKAGPHGQ